MANSAIPDSADENEDRKESMLMDNTNLTDNIPDSIDENTKDIHHEQQQVHHNDDVIEEVDEAREQSIISQSHVLPQDST